MEDDTLGRVEFERERRRSHSWAEYGDNYKCRNCGLINVHRYGHPMPSCGAPTDKELIEDLKQALELLAMRFDEGADTQEYWYKVSKGALAAVLSENVKIARQALKDAARG